MWKLKQMSHLFTHDVNVNTGLNTLRVKNMARVKADSFIQQIKGV